MDLTDALPTWLGNKHASSLKGDTPSLITTSLNKFDQLFETNNKLHMETTLFELPGTTRQEEFNVQFAQNSQSITRLFEDYNENNSVQIIYS